MKQVAIGIDIGGTNTVLGIVDRDGNLLDEASIPTQTHEKVEMYVHDLKAQINKLIEKHENEIEVHGIGIGAPNGNYHNGTIEHAANLRWKGIIKLVDMFKESYNMTVALTNDANAAAMGEMMYGAAKGMKDFVVITLGTGLGSGIVVNGDLVYGHDGFAGEVGHTNVYPNGRECGCGKKGCLETYVSATGMERTMAEILCNSNKPSKLRDIPYNDFTSLKIELALKDGDELAQRCFDYTGEILGRSMADTVAHTSPEAIFLFGGMAKAGDLILKPAQKALDENLLPIFKGKVTFKLSGLLDVNAAILGASALVWNELKK